MAVGTAGASRVVSLPGHCRVPILGRGSLDYPHASLPQAEHTNPEASAPLHAALRWCERATKHLPHILVGSEGVLNETSTTFAALR